MKNRTLSYTALIVLGILAVSLQPPVVNAGGGGDSGGGDSGGGGDRHYDNNPGGNLQSTSTGFRPDGTSQTTMTSKPDRDGNQTISVSRSNLDGTVTHTTINVGPDGGSDSNSDQYGNNPQTSPSAASATLTATACYLGLDETICQQPITLEWTRRNTNSPRKLFQGNTEIQRGLASSGSRIVEAVSSSNRTFSITHRTTSLFTGQRDTTLVTRTAPITCLAGVPSGNTCVCPTGQFPNSDNTDCVSFVIPDITFAPDRKLVRIGDSATLNVSVTVNQGATIECAVAPATRITSTNPARHTFATAGTHQLVFTTGPINNLSSFSVECYDIIDDAATRVPASTSVEVVPRTQEV